MIDQQTDRGQRAGYDPKTGAVSGSGAGAGNPDDEREDYNSDTKVRMPSEKPDGAESASAPGGGS